MSKQPWSEWVPSFAWLVQTSRATLKSYPSYKFNSLNVAFKKPPWDPRRTTLTVHRCLLELLSQLTIGCWLSDLLGHDSRDCHDRRVILGHRSWISVFFLHSSDGMSTVENSRLLQHCWRQAVHNSSSVYMVWWPMFLWHSRQTSIITPQLKSSLGSTGGRKRDQSGSQRSLKALKGYL